MCYQDHQTYFCIHSIKLFFVLSAGTAYFSPFLKYLSVGNSEMWNLSARALLTVASTAARTPELWDGGEANHARQPQMRCWQKRSPDASPQPTKGLPKPHRAGTSYIPGTTGHGHVHHSHLWAEMKPFNLPHQPGCVDCGCSQSAGSHRKEGETWGFTPEP